MLASEFNYNLPPELIAQHPVRPRDSSRLMVVNKKKQTIEHRRFFDIIDYLQAGDLIVWNNSKVFKARLFGTLLDADNGKELFDHKKPVEIFLVREMENVGVWKVLAKPGRHVEPGMRVRFSPSTHSVRSGQDPDFYCDVIVKESGGEILVQFPDSADIVREKANKYGHIPVPPYVKDEPHELESYQTVYAKHEGSVAAPTAGFHFTPDLIQKLKNKGVDFAEITLHVGLGTFLPVKSERVEDHTMHSEWVELSEENAEKINLAKKEGRRVVAVGTTTVRTLEGVAMLNRSPLLVGEGQGEVSSSVAETPSSPPRSAERSRRSPTRGRDILQAYKGDINLFIMPGFEFRVVDAMITNFHLPKSTLLMLVSAFVGDTRFVLECYQQAVEEKYRFYSFGDAMLII